MDTWKTTGVLIHAREGHTATLLPNGNVLLAAGGVADGGPSNTAELFNPRTGRCASANSLFYDRVGHTAALLPNGKVIVVGGTADTTTELYDSESGNWYSTGRLNISRQNNGHALDLMMNGRVLVAGGYDGRQLGLRAAEEYDSVTQVWSTVGDMSVGRLGLTLTALLDGRVIAVGGAGTGGPSDSSELYDPKSQTWSPPTLLFAARINHTATRLADGRVLVAGGLTRNDAVSNFCELFEPASGNWFSVGPLKVARAVHQAVLMNDGRVLVLGGLGGSPSSGGYVVLDSVEVFDPTKLTWTLTASMSSPRSGNTATLLRGHRGAIDTAIGREDSVVFVAGGLASVGDFPKPVGSTEVYEAVHSPPALK